MENPLHKTITKLEIHLTVSPIHHSELMNPRIEKIVRKKLIKDLMQLTSSIYGVSILSEPIIIFSPEHTETILEVI